MKNKKSKKAPKVSILNPKHPNYMKESDKERKKTNPMAPLSKKSLSK